MEKEQMTHGATSSVAVKELVPDCLEAQHPHPHPQTKTYTTLRVVLVKPSKYDDEGYVIRFWKGVLPSNTLNVLHGLTEDIERRRVLGDIQIQVDVFDETAEKIPVKKIVQWSRQPTTKLVVCLVGVQTNQFPRALDLGRQFRSYGIDVIMGGFHTSGTINMLSDQEPDIQELFRESIIVVSGEVEGHWEGILADLLNGELKPLYSFAQDLKNLVDIDEAPLPVISPKTMKHFARRSFGTVETSRGCPFACTFCTIINVQGRTMRERSPEYIAELVRKNYLTHGIDFYFFTDDNFARKRWWRETFEAIIRLREEGIKISFMMQVDLARKPKDFVRLAAEAGCSQVFIGMESVNPENLKAEGKPQNKVEQYVEIMREWHDAGVAIHAGYIIGLPFDTKEGVARDVQYLTNVIQPDQASFFMLTPLPGSHDHLDMKKRDEWMDPDFNKRDSFHPTITHPHMTAEEWTQAYEDAWTSFYSKENLTAILSRWSHNPKVYWNLFFVHMWYKNAALIEKQHPMIAGFFRLKARRSRRPGYSIDSLPVHLWKRTKDVVRLFLSWARFLKEMEEIWLQTRPRSEREKRALEEIQRIQGEIWRTLRIAEWQKAYNDAKVTLPAKARVLLDPFEDLSSRMLLSRKDLDTFLKKWGSLQTRIQKLYGQFAGEEGPAKRWLDQLYGLHRDAWQSLNVEEWREVYSGVREGLPSRLQLLYLKFDALSNRVVYSRQDLKTFWTRTREHLRRKRFWNLQPSRLAVTFFKELLLTTAFARSVISSLHSKHLSFAKSE
ncbi:MAG: radical SAM protein [Candidatus Methylomirabilis oxyfera]|nr:radical SAM protein [Candidatus Methylomirabilis oxyfera]